MSLNLASFLDVTAAEHPDATALKLDDFTMSYTELAVGVKRVANMLVNMGVEPGDKVAMMIPNTPHFPLLYYGILSAGATVVPLNCLLKAAEIQYQIEDSDAAAFFAWRAFEEEAAKAFYNTETCKNLVIVSRIEDTEKPKLGELFTPLFFQASGEFEMVSTTPEDTAVIVYTSGTTGTPKGAELTHFNIFFNAFYAMDHIVKAKAGDISLAVLPLFHSFGQTCVMNVGLMSGATLTMLPTFDTEKTMEVIQRDKVTHMAAVPTMYFWMLSLEGGDKYDLSSLRLAVSGGAALPVEVLNRFRERYGVRILEGYGLTETSPICSFNMECRPGSIGTPIWGVDMRVILDDGTFADVGDTGEIVVRGHNVMKGYYKKPSATEAAIVDGWFHTGDVGKRDENGYFFIVDRKKDLIIRGGMNVYPREIEEVLYGHPDVIETCVIGVADAARGEEVRAYVALSQGAETTDEELRQYCAERMARYKVPKQIKILAGLPKGPTGKLLKRELREMARQEPS